MFLGALELVVAVVPVEPETISYFIANKGYEVFKQQKTKKLLNVISKCDLPVHE